MKKLLKYLGIALGLLLVIALIAGFTINMRGIPSFALSNAPLCLAQ